jgi:hypothetical protein
MNIREFFPSIGGAAALAFGLTMGCQGAGGAKKIEEALAQINEKQDSIIEKMDALEKKMGERPSPRGKGGGNKPDPKLAYKVPIEGSHWKGGSSPKVTLVEFSDFQ